ncbi:spore coat U domain-containing protein [Sphingobium aquiterrae]|uniref:Csu type fimbrial protein n=1 Tax=Sphingobium aquiterrae TaxID=2038656 RepID=UPI00301AF6D4
MRHRGNSLPGVPRRDMMARALGIAMASVAALPSAAEAATSALFQASATIVSGCEINRALPAGGASLGEIGTLDFGTHSALATGPATAMMAQDASVELRCTPDVTLTMTTDAGLHGGTTRNLQASHSSDRLPYRLYRDAAFSQEVLANQPIAVSFSAASQISLPLYGRMTLPGNMPPDTYGDTIVVTLNW